MRTCNVYAWNEPPKLFYLCHSERFCHLELRIWRSTSQGLVYSRFLITFFWCYNVLQEINKVKRFGSKGMIIEGKGKNPSKFRNFFSFDPEVSLVWNFKFILEILQCLKFTGDYHLSTWSNKNIILLRMTGQLA